MELKGERQIKVVPGRSMGNKQCSELCSRSKEGSERVGGRLWRENILIHN